MRIRAWIFLSAAIVVAICTGCGRQPPAFLVFELQTNSWSSHPGPERNETITTEVAVKPGESIGRGWRDEPPFTLVRILDKHHAMVQIAKRLGYYGQPDQTKPEIGDGEPVIVSLQKLRASTLSHDAGANYTLRIVDLEIPPAVRADSPELVAAIAAHGRVVKDAVGSVQGVVGGKSFSDSDMPHLAKLNNLRRLTVAHCSITDAGMVYLKDAERLAYLNLNGSSISDAGVRELAGLKHLEALDLSLTNVGDGSVDLLLGLTSLELLDVKTRRLTPKGLWKLRQGLPQCRVLYFHERPWGKLHRRSGVVGPEQLAEEASEHGRLLLELLVAGCDLKANARGEIIEASVPGQTNPPMRTAELKREALLLLSEVRTIEKLVLGPKGMPPDFPEPEDDMASISKLDRLKEVNLQRCWLTEAGCKHLAALDQLEDLQLPDGRVDGGGLEYIAKLRRLKRLDLSGTHLSDAGVAHLAALHDLEYVDFGGASITDAGLACLGGFRNLKHLNVRDTQTAGAALAHLGGSKSLRYLDIGFTKITDANMAALSRLPGLEHLSLHGTQVTDAGLAHVAGLHNLIHLDIGHTRITDAGLTHLSGLHNLKYLNIVETKVTRPAP